jgi:hypothetical protein
VHGKASEKLLKYGLPWSMAEIRMTEEVREMMVMMMMVYPPASLTLKLLYNF